MKHVIFPIVLLLLFSACEPEPLETRISVDKPRLVLTPLLPGKHKLGLMLTRSFSPTLTPESDPMLIYSQLKVEKASVELETEGRQIALNNLSPFFYTDALPLRPYATYTIRIYDSVSREHASASTRMMPEPDTLGIRLSLYKTPGDTALKISVRLKDDGSIKRRYLLCFTRQRIRQDNLFSETERGRSLFRQLEIFDNSKAEGSVLEFSRTYDQDLYPFRAGDSLLVSVSMISEEYERFLKVYRQAGSLLSQLTSEPLNFPSNVSGGLGFFFLSNPVRRVFAL